jgi:choline dehydrogenase-like flavoprotein
MLEPGETTMTEFDYVIVGAGAAGCVLANRLSESGRHTVALIEAGGNDSNIWIKIPAGFNKTVYDAKLNWGYETAPGPFIDNRRIKYPRGKVLGGSGSINGHLYVRGQAADYDMWAQLGCRGWSWTDVLPYFKRAESRIGADHVIRENFPGPDCQSDEQWMAHARATGSTTYHPVGTCKLGTDPLAVVDPLSMRVMGLTGLRVADASCMPRMVSGNTYAATNMIAEKASDLIAAG